MISAILFIVAGTVVNVFGQVEQTPQIEPNDLYFYKGKDGGSFFNFMFRFQSEGVVLYSYEYNGASTLKGNWTLENDVLTVILPKGNAPITVKFKLKDDALEIIDAQDLHPMISAGTLFRKYLNNPPGKDLSAREFAGLILKFVKNISSVNDLSAENIEREMGEKVWFSEEDRSNYGFWGNIRNSSWRYGVNVYVHPTGGTETTDTLRFSIDDPTENADMSSACVELESFRKDLKSNGFSYSTAFGVHNIFVHVYVRGNGGNYEAIKQNCIERVLVGAENAGKK